MDAGIIPPNFLNLGPALKSQEVGLQEAGIWLYNNKETFSQMFIIGHRSQKKIQ